MRKLFPFLLLTLLVAACQPTPGDVSSSATPPLSAETATASTIPTESQPEPNYVNDLRTLLLDIQTREQGIRILKQIEATTDTHYVAGLIDVLRYQQALTPEISETLAMLTGLSAAEAPGNWFDWAEWAGKHPEIESFAEYDLWKSSLFSLIDPQFNRFVYVGVKVAPESRLEEIDWGGVRVDGIPALDNPKMIDPAEATYLEPQERIFGVSINGDTRAYPARFLDWHEMFNDVVGGEPVSLAY